ncbi:MAG: hypothetical protein OEY66_02920 [Gammaproteobacteria bacterium]|nr:hypothetical protein [Gammaproteobacteria bacterium]
MKISLKLTSTAILLSGLATITGCSSDDSSSGSVGVAPPANAIVIDSANAETIATAALDTTSVLLAKGSPATVSTGGVINEALDRINTNRKNSGLDLVSGVSFNETYNCTTDFPDTEGAPNTYTDKGNFTGDVNGSASGSTTFVSCDFGMGAVLNGTLNWNSSWNGPSYTDNASGNLTMQYNGLTVAIKSLSFRETGSDYWDGGTGDYSISTLQYVYDPGTDGFAVQTTTAIQGNEYYCGPHAGIVLITGGSNSKARITFNSDMSVTIEYDTGDGTYTATTNSPIACF